MFNVKAGAIAAAAAFFISLLVGVFSGAAFPVLILRPFLFAILFFIISVLINLMVSRFLPELLDSYDPGGDLDLPGSRVNISEDGPPRQAGAAAPVIPSSYALADDSEENLGDITAVSRNTPVASVPKAKVSTELPQDVLQEVPLEFSGLDQGTQDRYTDNSVPEAFREPGDSSAPRSVPESGSGNPVDALPDLDSLAGAFLPQSGEEVEETVDYSTPTPAKKPSTSSKGQKMEGDFNPKDLAEGIRTILKKEG